MSISIRSVLYTYNHSVKLNIYWLIFLNLIKVSKRVYLFYKQT